MNIQRWIHYFEDRKGRFVEPDWSRPCELADTQRRDAIGKSLAVFQLGETGGGTRLVRFATRYSAAHELSAYVHAVRLFVAEEQEHARLLSHLVQYLGCELIEKQWSNSVFRRVRGLVNLEFNIQLLLTAELIAEVYYGALARRAGDRLVELICKKILCDEVKHIAFHVDFFRHRLRQLSPFRAALWNAQFRCIHLATSQVVWRDHRNCFSALGLTRSRFMELTKAKRNQFLKRLGAGSDRRIATVRAAS